MEKSKNNIIVKIRNYINSEKATITQKEIGDFIINNYEDLPNIQLKEIENKIEVSQSSVIRFLKSLDLKGYKELISEIEKIISSDNNDISYKNSEIYVEQLFQMFEAIKLGHIKVTPTEKKIFHYLDDNIVKITNSSINELAKKIDVSPGSIYNFFEDKLMVKSYSKLKRMLTVYFNFQEAINKADNQSDEYSYNKNQKLNNIDTIDSLLKEINNNISSFLFSYDLQKSDSENIFLKFNKIILNSSNILIFDHNDLTTHLLHNNLNDLGFLNSHMNSYDKTINKIDLIKKNSDFKKEKLSKSLKKHIIKKKEFIDSEDVSTNLMNHIAEKTINERNLIIIIATDKYNKKINEIIDKSIYNNFSIILFEANHNSKVIGQYSDIDLRINIGDSFVINENKTRETITLNIILHMLIHQFKESIK